MVDELVRRIFYEVYCEARRKRRRIPLAREPFDLEMAALAEPLTDEDGEINVSQLAECVLNLVERE